MAKETEDKELNIELLTSGVTNCIKNPKYGQYYVAMNSEQEICGSCLITFEMSTSLGGLIYWI